VRLLFREVSSVVLVNALLERKRKGKPSALARLGNIAGTIARLFF
jgi:hypothetical protein